MMTKKELIRIKKVDSKVNYKIFHLDTKKEVEESKHLVGDSYANNVLSSMSDEDIY